MNELLWVIMTETAIVLACLVVLLVLLIWWLLRKLVVVPAVPVIEVATDKTSYARGETVQISGTLVSDGNPLPGETVGLAIQPPTGDAYSLPSVTTDAEGKFSASWQVPANAETGSYTLTATGAGVSDTTTFTLRAPG